MEGKRKGLMNDAEGVPFLILIANKGRAAQYGGEEPKMSQWSTVAPVHSAGCAGFCQKENYTDYIKIEMRL